MRVLRSAWPLLAHFGRVTQRTFVLCLALYAFARPLFVVPLVPLVPLVPAFNRYIIAALHRQHNAVDAQSKSHFYAAALARKRAAAASGSALLPVATATIAVAGDVSTLEDDAASGVDGAELHAKFTKWSDERSELWAKTHHTLGKYASFWWMDGVAGWLVWMCVRACVRACVGVQCVCVWSAPGSRFWSRWWSRTWVLLYRAYVARK